jgi:hypothetical protein
VLNSSGQSCGTLLWESKRTKNWSDAWLAKLLQDQRAAKADFAFLVSRALPKGVDLVDYIEGIWVLDPKYAIPVAIALRQSIIEVAAVRQAGDLSAASDRSAFAHVEHPGCRSVHLSGPVAKPGTFMIVIVGRH